MPENLALFPIYFSLIKDVRSPQIFDSLLSLDHNYKKLLSAEAKMKDFKMPLKRKMNSGMAIFNMLGTDFFSTRDN